MTNEGEIILLSRGTGKNTQAFELATNTLEKQKNGYWFREYHYGDWLYKCSQCNNAVKYITPYCQNCGAKMEVEE